MRSAKQVLLAAGLAAALCAAGCSPDRGKELRTYRMGDRVELGKLVYSIYESRWHTQLGEGPAARIPQHRFFLVKFSVTNNGGAETLSPALTATDSKGADYAELSDGSMVPDWAGYLRNLKPGQTLEGNALFDCPAGNYKIHIADENDQLAALINVPLTFTAETQEVPAVEIPEKGEKK
jgi:hypothetical protein